MLGKRVATAGAKDDVQRTDQAGALSDRTSQVPEDGRWVT